MSVVAERQFEFTRAWKYEGEEGEFDKSLIMVDGQQIGGVYFASARDSWASFGPLGYTFDFPTREAAEQAQVREYATNPDLFDRLNAQARAEQEAEQARIEAEQEARRAERDAEERRRRLGDDEPGPTIWTLPAYHVFYAPAGEVQAVSTWLKANEIGDKVLAAHEVRVEQRADRRAVVFESEPLWQTHGRGRVANPETWVVTLVADPPEIVTPPRPDLHDLLEQHWPAEFPLLATGVSACAHCTPARTDKRTATIVPWPCPVVEAAVQAGAMAVAS